MGTAVFFWDALIAPLDDMIDELPPFPDMKASVRDVSMKIMAALVVNLLKNVVPPPAPKTDWLPPAPNDAPISAPLPDCSRTMTINAKHTRMCNITSSVVIDAFSSKL